MNLGDRIRAAWNVFKNRDPTNEFLNDTSNSVRLDKSYLRNLRSKTIIGPIYNRIAMDTAAVNIYHIKLDSKDRFESIIKSGLNTCLTLEANIDQTGRAFIQDAVISMFDEGVVALVPVDTIAKPISKGGLDILSIRTAKVVTWYPSHVRVEIYNDSTGKREEITLPKNKVALVENPLYSVMNEPGSTMQRLIRKLNLLDSIDEQSFGKLDLIIQLPYVVKSESRKEQAKIRRGEIEEQLTNSKYGVAYTDATERITQLNRPLENNIMSQIEYLTNLLYSQLGLTQGVMDGSASESEMLNYYNRTIEPILSAISDELKRKFIGRVGLMKKQSIGFFRDPFKLVPIGNIADIADKFTRNEILSSNEVRQSIGFIPSKNPKADELLNKNISQSKEQLEAKATESEVVTDNVENV